MDHLARRRRDVAAKLERIAIRLGQLALLQVGQHVLQPLHQILAAGLYRPCDDRGIG
jgi:hypothetical protein